MSLNKHQRQEIQQFIIQNVRAHPLDIVRVTQKRFNLSRTAILRYIHLLENQNRIKTEGLTKDRKYFLPKLQALNRSFALDQPLAEDKVWRIDVLPLFGGIKENVLEICNYGFTEIFNNAIDHSEGTEITIQMDIYADQISMIVMDNGIGIFNKIQREYQLDDPMHAILELSKGKLTTDPDSHTGEGIFFTSRMFDTFMIASGNLTYGHKSLDLFYEDDTRIEGTAVIMKISPLSDRTMNAVFSQFVSSTGDFGFDKTIVPVLLARIGNENLISRSQAKRLLARLERFRTVVLDFDKIETIGRAFADEVFRVFTKSHPATSVISTNENESIRALITEITKEK